MLEIPVSLTKREMTMAAECGAMRNILAVFDDRRPTPPIDPIGWNAHIEGACGEVAVAKAFGWFWSPTCNTFHDADIGTHFQVRARSKHHYDLHIRNKDNPDHCYILATGIAPDFILRGWIKGVDARQDRFLLNPGGYGEAWFVPQGDLLDLALLKR